MRKTVFVGVIVVMLLAGLLITNMQEKQAPEKAVAAMLVVRIDAFAAAREQLLQAVIHDADEKELKKKFRDARLAYKKIEWATEYFVPLTTKFVNGAPVPEVEASGIQILEPQGLQVIENILFPAYDKAKKQELIQRLQLMQNGCEEFRSHFTDIEIIPGQVYDAAKLQVFRVITLGITGFDTPLSQNSLEESAISLQDLAKALAFFAGDDKVEELSNNIDRAKDYLRQHNNFNDFDRAEFITQYANPLSRGITRLEKQQHIQVIRYNRLLNQDAETLFDTNAFNANAYISDISFGSTPDRVALGQKLFEDPILSMDGSRSCMTCHQPRKAFTDGLVKNTELNGNALLLRNTPTLINAALQPAQFYDLRTPMLEDQAATVIGNKVEMHGSLVTAAAKLWKDEAYRRMFTQAYPRGNRVDVDTLEVIGAIGAYVRSLTALNSRFDDYMRGNHTAMDQQEVHGFNLFMGKAKCGTCHYVPIFNGTLPPRYTRIETEVIGTPADTAGKSIDADMGRYNLVKIDFFKHAFKTSTVRNAALTAPYMHNGVFTTLDQVVDFYNKGGGAGMGITVENQTLPFDKLNLSKQECDDIVAFIKTLDSKVPSDTPSQTLALRR